MPNEFLYQRGARRSAAPQFAPWTPPQSAANISAQSLAALLRQPQQAQQAPQQQQMQRRATEDQGDPGAAQMMSGPGPAQLTRMLQALTADGNLNVDGPSDNQSMGNIGFNPNAGPMNPAIGRLLKGLTVFGLGTINPLVGAVANGIINNPDSATGVTSSLATAGLKQAIDGLGVIDTMRQIFGADPVSRVVDRQLQSLTAAAPVVSPAVSAPGAGDAGWDTYNQAGVNQYGWSRDYGWGNETDGANFSDRGPDGSSGPTDGDGAFGFGRNTGNTGGAVRGGGSFGEGQY